MDNEFKIFENKWKNEQLRVVSDGRKIKVELLVKQLRELICFLTNSGLNHTEYGRFKLPTVDGSFKKLLYNCLPTVDDSFKRLLLRQDEIKDCMKGKGNLNQDDCDIDEITSGMKNIDFNRDSGSYGFSDLNNCLGNRLDSFPLSTANKTLSKNEFLKSIKWGVYDNHENRVLQELNDILWQKKSAFYEYDRKFGHYNGPLKMDLKVVGGMTYNSKSAKQSDNLDEQLEMGIYIYNLLREGIIEPSNSPILSPPNLVMSEGTKRQFGGKFGSVNKILQSAHSLVPSIFNTVQKIGCKGFYTMLKLEYPFYQIDIDEKSKYLTSVSTQFGNFQFNRLCYGLGESSNVIHKVVKSVFDGEDTTIYYDYIIFSNDNIESHFEFIGNALDKAIQFGLKLSLTDCTFVRDRFVKFGYNVCRAGIYPDYERIHRLSEKYYIGDKSQLKSFIGKLNIYRHHIPLSSFRLSELHKAEKNVPFNFVNDIVNDIKCEVENYFPLKPPNYDESFVIFIDVSIHGVTSVLVQDTKPIEFYTHCFENHGKKFVDYKLAIDGLVDVLEKFASYIYSKRVLVITDSTNPICLMTLKNISNIKISSKNFITSFNVTVNYLKKSSSKVFKRIKRGEFEIKEGEIGSMEDVFPTHRRGGGFSFILKNFKQFYDNNDSLKSFNFYRHNKSNRRFTYVPRVLRYTLLVKWHNSMKHGRHKCDKRTISHFKSIFFWYGMDSEISKTWRFCNKCMMRRYPKFRLKRRQKKSPPSEPWDTLNVNFMNVDGIIDLLVVIDDFCKFITLKQLSTVDDDTIVSAMKDCIRKYKEPKCIITDRSSVFENPKFKEMCEDVSTKHSPNDTYTEKFKCVLKVLSRLLEESSKKFSEIDIGKRIEILEVVHNYNHKNEAEKSPVECMMEVFDDLVYKKVDSYMGKDHELWEFYEKQLCS
uniref:Integrase catalytic domain-containing protein n=1 Tax=Strongyloides papillosus TaxID=174720 RepID=A0A0N5CB30_STREA